MCFVNGNSNYYFLQMKYISKDLYTLNNQMHAATRAVKYSS